MLRVLTWMAVGLVAFSHLVPIDPVDNSKSAYNRKLTSTRVRDVTLDHNDPRGFLTPHHSSRVFTIDWIGPSTLQSLGPPRYSFIPDDVRKILPTIGGRKVVVEMYFLSGARILDLYAATAAAAATHPNMILVDLNPLWLFNDAAVQGWPSLDGVVLNHELKTPATWPLVAAFDSPRDFALAEVSRFVTTIRDRWSYAQDLRTFVGDLSLLTTQPATPVENPSDLQRIAAMSSPLEFWSRYRPSGDPAADMVTRQLDLLKQSRLDGSVINDSVLSALLDTLVRARIPSLVYMPPINQQSLARPDVDAVLHHIEAHLQQIANHHTAPTLVVQSVSLSRVLGALRFRDLVHLAADGPVVAYFAQAICSQLLSEHVVATCAPLTAGSP